MGAGDRPDNPGGTGDDSKEEAGFRPLTAAAVIGGAVAATAGAYLGTRALARRNREKDGRPINSVMAAAITASALDPDKEAAVPSEPPALAEPKA